MVNTASWTAAETQYSIVTPDFMDYTSDKARGVIRGLESILQLTREIKWKNREDSTPSERIGDDILRDIDRSLTALLNPQNIEIGEFQKRFDRLSDELQSARPAWKTISTFAPWDWKVVIAWIYLEKLLELTGKAHNYKKDSSKVAEDILKWLSDISDTGEAIKIDKRAYMKKLWQAKVSWILESAEALLNLAISGESYTYFFEAEELLSWTNSFQHWVEFTPIGIERWKRLLEKSAEILPKMLDAAIERQIEMLEEQAWRNEPGRRVYIAQLLTRAKVTRWTNKEFVSQLEKVVAQYPL